MVYQVTFSGAVPGEEVATFLSNRRTNDALKQNRLYEMLACDPDYVDAYGLQVVAGRNFSEDYGDDVDKLVINETAVRNLGFTSNDEAIGELVNVECTDAPDADYRSSERLSPTGIEQELYTYHVDS